MPFYFKRLSIPERSSPTFGQWIGVELANENNLMLYIPLAFAHGFVVLSDAIETPLLSEKNRRLPKKMLTITSFEVSDYRDTCNDSSTPLQLIQHFL